MANLLPWLGQLLPRQPQQPVAPPPQAPAQLGPYRSPAATQPAPRVGLPQAQQTYANLTDSLRAGRISPNAFGAAINQLTDALGGVPQFKAQDIIRNPVTDIVGAHLVQPLVAQAESVGHNLKIAGQAAWGNQQAQQEFLKGISPPTPTVMKDGKKVPNPDFIKYAQNVAGTESGVEDVNAASKAIGGVDKVPVTKASANPKAALSKSKAADAQALAKQKLDQLTQANGGSQGNEMMQHGAAMNNYLFSKSPFSTPEEVARANAGMTKIEGVGQKAATDVKPKVALKVQPNLNEGAFSNEDLARLDKLNAQDKAQAAARQVIKPNSALGKVSSGVEKQLNPPLSQAERLKLGNPEKNPLYGKVGVPAAQDAAQAHFNATFVSQHEQTVGQQAVKAVNQLSSTDQELLKQVQTKGPGIASQAENPAQFKQALNATRQYYDLRHAYDHYLGIQTPYRANYLRDLVERNNPDAMPLSGGNKTPGYTQAKTTPGYSNVSDALQRDINGASFNHAKLVYTKGLDEAYPGKIQAGKPYTDANTQLQTPYGQELFAPKELAGQINNRAPAPKATGLTGKYDTANAFLKYAKLSGGAFHAFTETGNFIGQQLMSGKLFTEPGSTGKIFKVMFSDKAMRGEMGNLAENGTLDKAKLGGLTWTPSEIKADVNVTPKGMIAKYTGIKALHDATFQRDIPYAKLKTFEQATQGLDPNAPADLLKIRQTAKAVNDGYGGINRAADGLTPKQAKVAARCLLATDFTEGKIRTVIAAIDKGGPEGKIARQIIAGKVLLFAGLATAGGALSGEYKGKDIKQIAQNILGNFINPTFKAGGSTVSFPATHVSEFGKPLTPLFKSSTDKFSGIKDYANNRLAAVPAEVGQLINNRDYSGQRIYGKETKKNGGGPISPGKTALNVASGVLPIPASQGVSAVQGKQSIPAAVANVIGLKVRPDTTPQPNTPKANKANATQEYSQYKAKTPQGYDLQKLSDGSFAYSVDGTPHQTASLKTAQRDIARDAFKNSDSNIKVIGDQVYRKSTDGTVSVTPKVKYDYSLNSATLTQQKKVNDVTGYFATAQRQLQNIQAQLKDPNTDPLDTITLKNEAQTLSDNLAKYQGYGGFSKPKGIATSSRVLASGGSRVKSTSTVARGSTKSSTGGSSKALASFKIANSTKSILPKGIKVKAVSYKAPKLRKISVSKIPKFSVKIKKGKQIA